MSVKYLNGTNGKTWYNGNIISEQTSMELKIAAKTDDINVCGDLGTGTALLGYSIEGTLKFNKWADDVTSGIISDVFKSITTGVPGNAKVIISLYDPSTGKSERYSVTEIVFTELSLKIEPKKVVEQELPFKARVVNLTETMD